VHVRQREPSLEEPQLPIAPRAPGFARFAGENSSAFEELEWGRVTRSGRPGFTLAEHARLSVPAAMTIAFVDFVDRSERSSVAPRAVCHFGEAEALAEAYTSCSCPRYGIIVL